MDIGGHANGNYAPVDLNAASREELLSIGWISVRDVDAILHHRGPQGQLYLSQMARFTSLKEEHLGELVRHGVVTVRLDEDRNNMGDTHSQTSVTSSMLEELEAMREENQLLREAIVNQSTVQEDVLSRFVGGMETEVCTPTGDQFVNMARQTAVTGAMSLQQPSVPIGRSEGVRDSMGHMKTSDPGRSTNPFVTPVDTHNPGIESASGRLDRSSARYVPPMPGNGGEHEVRSSHVDDSFEQGSTVEQHHDYSAWTELQHLRLQMDMLLTRARQSQTIFNGVSPSHESARVGNDRVVSDPGSSRLRGGNMAQVSASTGDSRPELPQRHGGVAQSDHQYFAGGRLVDSGYGPMDSWNIRVPAQVEQSIQPQLQPRMQDYARAVGYRDERDSDGYGWWGQCASSYRIGNGDQSSLMEDWRQTPGQNEEASSDERSSDSRQSRRSSQRNRASRDTQQTHSDSSGWRARSLSSLSCRSPSTDRSGRHRHQSPPFTKPPVFSGKEGEWDSFIFQFHKIAHYYGWDQQEKVDRLLVSLRGKAIDFVRNKSRKVQDDYRALQDALELRFGKREHPTSARRELNYLQQHERESLEDFADIVLAKVSEAYPRIGHELEQDIAKEIFLRGCRNRKAAYAAAEKDPTTLQDALERVRTSAMNWKVFGRSSVSTRRVRFAGQEEENGDAYSASEEEKRLKKLVAKLMKECEKERNNAGPVGSTIKCYQCGNHGHLARGCGKDVICCFGCGETGHIRSECPKRDERIGSAGSENECAPLVRAVSAAAGASSPVPPVSSQPQVRKIHWSPNQSLSMEVPVLIGRRKVMALVDTAAQVTVVNRELSIELGYEAPVERVQLRNALTDSWMDGGIVEEFGFRLGSKKSRWDVVEADIGDALIIGIDFLKHMKCKIDLGSNILELGNGDRVPMTVRRSASTEAVPVSRVVLSSERERKQGPINMHGGKLDGTGAVISAGAAVLPGASAQGCTRVYTEQPASCSIALSQDEMQSKASVRHDAPSASKSSSAAHVRLVQREDGRSVSVPEVTKAFIDEERWAPQDITGRQTRGSNGKTTPNHVPCGKELKGKRPAGHSPWRSGSQRQAKSVRKERSRSGFWSPVPQLEEWESWRDWARRPARVKNGCK